MSIEIKDPGLRTTIQDLGRSGYARWGVPASGMMDDHSGRLANYLCGNEFDAPLLEISLKGGTYSFNKSTVFAICGGSARCELNDQSIELFESHTADKGDTLKIGNIASGVYVYLAARGMNPGDRVMKSFSTCLPAGFGGWKGRALEKGDIIPFKDHAGDADPRKVDPKWIPHFSSKTILKCLPGSEWKEIPAADRNKLLEGTYKVASSSDRMGIRLQSDRLNIKAKEMRSSPVVPGIVQSPGSGQLILLHRDAQTVGGYPRVLKVIEADLWRAAQVRPGNTVRFKIISDEQAKHFNSFRLDIYSSLLK